jgi:divinyl chlorophyllide a 8-vinyl-reductase
MEILLAKRTLVGPQVKLVKEGKPYVMFGDGRLAACKPISEADLASFMADCVKDSSKANQVLPIGGDRHQHSHHEYANLQGAARSEVDKRAFVRQKM